MEKQRTKIIIMNIKSKLLAVLLISLIVFVGGGFVLYNQYQGNDMIGSALKVIIPESDELYDDVGYTPMGVTGVAGYNPSQRIMPEVNRETPSLLDDNGISSTAIASSRNTSSANVAIGHLPKSSKEIRASGDANQDMGMIAGISRSGSTSSRNIGEVSTGIGISGAYTSGPMAVPFSSGGRALIDPEPVTLEEGDKNQIVPVGDGVIALMLLSLTYGFVIFRRRK